MKGIRNYGRIFFNEQNFLVLCDILYLIAREILNLSEELFDWKKIYLLL